MKPAARAILVVEDNPQISEIIAAYLERDGFQVEVQADASAGLLAFQQRSFDLAILDVMLPDFDGCTLCREMRKTSEIPILMVSARDDPLDRVLGLEVGADDYLSKPFHAPELLLRIHGLLRRVARGVAPPAQPDSPRVQRGDLCLEPDSRRAFYAGQPLALTRTEFDLLLTFATHAGQVLSRERLVERVWGSQSLPEMRIVDTHLRNLRSKLRQISPHQELIRSIRGIGYRLE